MSSNPQETADLVKFKEEILNGKLHFLYSFAYRVLSHQSVTKSVLKAKKVE